MEYMVIGADGKEYGPSSFETLKQWVAESRVLPTTSLRNFSTGQVMRASDVVGLFEAPVVPPASSANVPPTMAYYPRQSTPQMAVDDGQKDIMGAIFRSVLALVFFFFLHGIGLVFAGYSVYYAMRAQQKGHKYGVVALAISIGTLVLIIAGYALKFGIR